ncbi:hypothetical protein BC833DRAFT_612388 [Globomyces pollinis-pini]|nr:hypothetical protein BC833DRAFT_612388 [Globomyces pollinis-pini]
MIDTTSSFTATFIYLATQKGGYWLLTFASLSVMYCYGISDKSMLWKVMLINGLSGLTAITIQEIYQAKRLCCSTEKWAFLLFINEIFWIIHEITTVMYSLFKVEILLNQERKRMVRYMMFGLSILYTITRFILGYVRFEEDTLVGTRINQIQSYSYLIWLLADLLLLILLSYSIYLHMNSTHQKTWEMIVTLSYSSIPRLLIIMLTTLMIVFLCQSPGSLDSDVLRLAWAIKSGFPFILLLDIHITKDLLIQHTSSNPLQYHFGNKK